jgi:ribosome biogenesis protein ERB1
MPSSELKVNVTQKRKRDYEGSKSKEEVFSEVIELPELAEDEDEDEDVGGSGSSDDNEEEFPEIDSGSDSPSDSDDDEDEEGEEGKEDSSDSDEPDLDIFPRAKTIISQITGEPKRVFPEIEADYDSDSSTEDVSSSQVNLIIF